MKAVDTNFRAHLDRDVTTLCTCWIITRRDGTIHRFTDADDDVVHDNEMYQSVGAYQRSSIESTATLAVDNLEVTGMANHLSLPIEKLRAGAFDNAEIKVFLTSWEGKVTGKVKLRRGFFGEVKVLPNGTFSVELRGVMQRLSHTYTKVYTPTCRNDLGDSVCRVVIFPERFESEAVAPANRVFWRPQDGAYLGVVRPVTVGDPDFENLGTFGFSTSRYWNSVGADAPLFEAATQASNGNYVMGIGSGTDVQVEQLIDLNEIEDLTDADIESGQVSLNVMSLWNCAVDEGRVLVDFFDRYNRQLNHNTLSRIASTGTADLLTVSGDFTLEGWFYVSAPGDIAHFTHFGIDHIGDEFYAFSIAGGLPQFSFRDPAISITQLETVITGEHAIPVGEWFHLSFSRSGTTYTITLNGALSTTAVHSWSGDVKIAHFWEGTFYFDELRLWNTPKTRAEVNEHRFRKLAGTEPSLLRYWAAFSITEIAATGADLDGATIGSTDAVSASPVAVTTTEGGATASAALPYATTAGLEVRKITNLDVPEAAKYARLRVQMRAVGVAGVDAYLDSIYAWVVDGSKEGTPPGIYGNTNYFKDDEDVVVTQESFARSGIVTISEGTRIFRCEIDEDRAVDGWFDFGLVKFETGNNAGGTMEVKSWKREGSIVELFLSMPSNIEPGDQFYIYPGCDKTRICCSAFFDNIINFAGTPDVPGEDEFMKYPDSK